MNSTYKKPLLILAGAGPGDPELITLKAIKAIQKADVILYDALINLELLEYAKPECLKISVGKKFGNHSHTQDEINELIVSQALRTKGIVLRLKGGDPFVFGRVYEEITYAENFGIETEVIPGISSAIALPGLQRIPLTQRGVSESFWVVTGTTRSGQISQDIVLAAKSTATLIILMGMNQLAEIIRIYEELGELCKPVAIIQNGSLPDEKMVVGNIGQIEDLVKRERISSPAVIVIGDTVAHSPHWKEEVLQQLKYAS